MVYIINFTSKYNTGYRSSKRFNKIMCRISNLYHLLRKNKHSSIRKNIGNGKCNICYVKTDKRKDYLILIAGIGDQTQ